MILAADIGGTKSRFGLYDINENGLQRIKFFKYENKNFGSFEELIKRVFADGVGEKLVLVRSVCFAVAGVILSNTECRMTNIDWAIDLDEIPAFQNKERIVINDFQAQMVGCFYSYIFSDTKDNQNGVYGVIGVGTGLGSSYTRFYDRLTPIATEAGHVQFSFCGDDEKKFEKYLLSEITEDYITAELLLTERGIRYLHKFLTGKYLSIEKVMSEIQKSPTFEWYAKFLGRFCRNFILTTGVTKTLFLSGGVLAKNSFLVENELIIKEINNSIDMKIFLNRVNVRLNKNEEIGLTGAAMWFKLCQY